MDQAKDSEMITLWKYLRRAAEESSCHAEEARGRRSPFWGTKLAILSPGTSLRHHPASLSSQPETPARHTASSSPSEQGLGASHFLCPEKFEVEPPLLPVPEGFENELPLLPVPEGFEDEPSLLPVPEGFQDEPPLLPVPEGFEDEPPPPLVPDPAELGDELPPLLVSIPDRFEDEPPSILVPVQEGFGEGAEDRLPSSPELQVLPRWPHDWDLRSDSSRTSSFGSTSDYIIGLRSCCCPLITDLRISGSVDASLLEFNSTFIAVVQELIVAFVVGLLIFIRVPRDLQSLLPELF
ncbi:hypothetical protein CRENBAI_023316 [Crenichthys baileyi]|uniref:Uncharacterized protein n=1 Tax=Crenichthys baileyi TaxID=28760 RepID=A0AAV9R5V0_9TELE